ncbi:MAG: cytochrome C oxidase subunit IV [Dehalococcoidia bacterium]|nr:cytochrome C oxidase subunit IV [Dehalococcoidia bacterium]
MTQHHAETPLAAAHTPSERWREKAHPGTATYAKAAVSLIFLTGVEVVIFYIDPLRSVVIPLFFMLSIIKFALVAMFYMHLRYDARLFSWFFVGGILLATSVICGLIALFKTIFV